MSEVARVVPDQAIVRTDAVADIEAAIPDTEPVPGQNNPPPGLTLMKLKDGAASHPDSLVRRIREEGYAADHNYVLAQMTHSRFQPISYYRPHPAPAMGDPEPKGAHILVIDTPVLEESPIQPLVREGSSTTRLNGSNAPVDSLVFHGGFAAGVALLTEPKADVEVVGILDTFQDKFYSDWELASQLMTIAGRAEADQPDIISLSLGASPLIAEAPIATKKALDVLAALDKDITVFASAGNDGERRVTYPAGLDGVYGVGGQPQAGGRRTDFSNYGAEHVDLWAPAVDVVGPVMPGVITFKPPLGEEEHHRHHVVDLPPSALGPQKFKDGWARADGTSWGAPFMAAQMAKRLIGGMSTADAIDDLKVRYGPETNTG